MSSNANAPVVVLNATSALAQLETSLGRVGRRKLIIVVDDSASLLTRGNDEHVRKGVNKLLDDQAALPYADMIDVTIVFLNERHALCMEVPIARAPRLSIANHVAAQDQTPLFRRSYYALKRAELQLAGAGPDAIACVVIATDGADNVAHLIGETVGDRDVRRVAERLWAGGRCLLAGIGVWDGRTDFFAVFAAMGIPERFVQAPAGTPQATAQGFDDVSVSISFATGSFDNFQQTMHTGVHRTPTTP